MDIDMDDLDLDLDPIRAFLQHKLDNIKSLGEEKKSVANGIRELLLKLQREHCNAGADSIKLGETWKRIYGGKYVIGIAVENTSGSVLTEISCILHCRPAISLEYTTKIYSIKPRPGFQREIGRAALLILIIEKPNFVKCRGYEVDGVVSGKLGKLDCQASLQKVRLDVKDYAAAAADGRLEIKNIHLINADRAAFVSALACLAQLELAAGLPAGTQRKLENYIGIDCMLREVEFDAVTYFLFDAVAGGVVDGAMCTVFPTQDENVYKLRVFYRNKDQLIHILHYLHDSIAQLRILPLKYMSSLKDHDEPFLSTQAFMATQKPVAADPAVAEFGAVLSSQIKDVIAFHSSLIENKSVSAGTDVTAEYKMLRDTMVEKERKLEELHEKLSNEL